MKIAIIQKQGGAAENDEENYTVFRADALWRITRRNRVDFTYYAMNRDGTSELTVDIPDPGGGSFPAGTIVKTDFDMSILRGSYAWSFFKNEHFDLLSEIDLSYGGFLAFAKLYF